MVEGKEVTCPVCGSSDAETLYYINSEQAASHVLSDITNGRKAKLKEIIEEIWGDSSARFLNCNKCSFVFSDPFVSGNREFYSLAYQNSNYYPIWKWEYQESFEELRRRYSSKILEQIKLLEIGAGNGAFVKKISENTLKKENILCTEYSKFGKRSIENSGIRCIQADIRDIHPGDLDMKFDVICMYQVLEHMDNLDWIFRNLLDLTSNDGILIISVPNDKQRVFYDNIGSFMDIPPTHISRWNQKSFVEISKKNGWVLERHEIEPMGFYIKLKKFLFNRYDYHFSIYQKMVKNNRKLALKIIHVFIFSILSFCYLPRIFQLMYKQLGISQWIVLKNNTNTVSL